MHDENSTLVLFLVLLRLFSHPPKPVIHRGGATVLFPASTLPSTAGKLLKRIGGMGASDVMQILSHR